jgi:hypothetical protein
MQYFKMMSILAMLAMRVQAVPLSARQIAAPAVIEVVAATNGPFSGDGTYYTPVRCRFPSLSGHGQRSI